MYKFSNKIELFSALIIIILIRKSANLTASKKHNCAARKISENRILCVCNSTYCDRIPRILKTNTSSYTLYSSDRAGKRFSKIKGIFNDVDHLRSSNEIRVDRTQTYQQINGFGGAFTDATGINIFDLSKEVQDYLMKSYFGKYGIGYNLCRVPIGGTDFSMRAYTYDDGDIDRGLNNFKLAPEDHAYKIPLIIKAKTLNADLNLFASSWSSPKWMKTNGQYDGFGFLLEEFYPTWANYFIKFLDNYHKYGIEFWGITTGNEPSLAYIGYKIMTVGWFPHKLNEWISKHLGPTLRNSNYSNIKIMTLDDQRLFLPLTNIILMNEARNFVDGIAVHWYMDFLSPTFLITETHKQFPDKFLLASEASHVLNGGRLQLGSWSNGEMYSESIIQDLSLWFTGWIDWNMATNLRGGPTYIDNFTDSPIIVNSTSNEFYKQPMFYHMGHFSKFITRNSSRIFSSQINNNIKSIAFKRSDDGIVVVILNKNNRWERVRITDPLRGTINIELTPKSINTIIYW